MTARYELREFLHFLSKEDDRHVNNLAGPLDKICSDFDGWIQYGMHNDQGYKPGSNSNQKQVNAIKHWVVGERNGVFAFVKIDVDYDRLMEGGSRRTKVINVEGYEHKELLNALHKFYSGKSGYDGMPEVEIVELPRQY